MSSRWMGEDVPRGERYDQRFAELAAAGRHVHGEADFVEAMLGRLVPGLPRRVLDAGCGTGRVAIELARRGVDVTGVDLDPAMLEIARAKAPALPWLLADLAELDLAGEPFSAAVLAGNVMIFLAPGAERRVLERVAACLAPGGVVAAGFQLSPGGLGLAGYDEAAAAAGLGLVERFATWEMDPLPERAERAEYAVSVHRRLR
ncbi:MAG: class I SAM-dependent DNA methyltransferase [Acidimicrobiales bacterium]